MKSAIIREIHLTCNSLTHTCTHVQNAGRTDRGETIASLQYKEYCVLLKFNNKYKLYKFKEKREKKLCNYN